MRLSRQRLAKGDLAAEERAPLNKENLMARKLRGKPVWLWSVIVVLVSICTGVVMANRHPFQIERYEDLKIFTEVLSYVEANYVEEVEPERVIHGAIRGMLRSLDPHSSFMPPEMFSEMQVETEGRFGGLGIEITIRDDGADRGLPYRGHAGLPGGHPGRR